MYWSEFCGFATVPKFHRCRRAVSLGSHLNVPKLGFAFGKLFVQVIWCRGSSFLQKAILRGNADWRDGLKRQPWSGVTEMASPRFGLALAEALWSEAVLPHNLHNRVRWWFNGFCRYLQQGCKWGRLAETNPSGTLKKNNYMKDEPQFTFQLLKSWEKCENERIFANKPPSQGLGGTCGNASEDVWDVEAQ